MAEPSVTVDHELQIPGRGDHLILEPGKGMARTVKQARQFISHGHVTVNGARVTVPSKKVEVGEEDTVSFDENSELADELHPARAEEQE